MSFPTYVKGYLFAALISLSLILTIIFAYLYFGTQQQYILTIGAGSRTGEAFQLAHATATLVEHYYPDIRIEVQETKGSSENMRLLEEGKIQLATVQADIEAVPQARLISNLYPDLFQLVVRQEANISSFNELKGKRIALPKRGGGQWVSFWFVARHYGLDSTMVQDIQLSSEQAVLAMLKGEVDALFRVRAAPNLDIARIISGSSSTIIPIHQGAAMQLKQPAMEVSIIPQGAYKGNPPIPATNIPTVSVSRLLIASEDTPPYVVKKIAQILYERRRELLHFTPLAGFIRQPDYLQGTFIPLHPGAKAFFDREKPHFLVENADFFALLLSLAFMAFSAIVGIRSFLFNRQKNLADGYTRQLVELTKEIRQLNTSQEIAQKKQQLQDILATVVEDLDKDRIRPEGFSFFSFTWNVAYEAIREKAAEESRIPTK